MTDKLRHSGSGGIDHPAGPLLEEYLDGALLSGEARALKAHLKGCAECSDAVGISQRIRAQLDALGTLEPSPRLADSVVLAVSADLERRRAVIEGLDALGHHAPSPGFGDAVVARVAARARAQSSAQGSAKNSVRGRRRAPETFEKRLVRWFRDPRQVFAALGGVSVVPIAVLVAVVSSVLSNDQISVSALVSFAQWKLIAALEAAGGFLGTAGLNLPSWTVTAFDSASSGPAFAALAGVMTLGTLASVWVLYRTLSAPPLTGTVNGHPTA
jgi:anti-sigma factor RsiW